MGKKCLILPSDIYEGRGKGKFYLDGNEPQDTFWQCVDCHQKRFPNSCHETTSHQAEPPAQIPFNNGFPPKCVDFQQLMEPRSPTGLFWRCTKKRCFYTVTAKLEECTFEKALPRGFSLVCDGCGDESFVKVSMAVSSGWRDRFDVRRRKASDQMSPFCHLFLGRIHCGRSQLK